MKLLTAEAAFLQRLDICGMRKYSSRTGMISVNVSTERVASGHDKQAGMSTNLHVLKICILEAFFNSWFG